MEHETYDKSEVEKVIRGEKIRQVEEKLKRATPIKSDSTVRLGTSDAKPQPATRPQHVTAP